MKIIYKASQLHIWSRGGWHNFGIILKILHYNKEVSKIDKSLAVKP